MDLMAHDELMIVDHGDDGMASDDDNDMMGDNDNETMDTDERHIDLMETDDESDNDFPPRRQSRTTSLNSRYMIVFKNPRDSLGVSTLACQMYPHSTNFLLHSFQDATKRPHGYLLLDLHQLTPENMRLRTNILPGEKQIVYVKRT